MKRRVRPQVPRFSFSRAQSLLRPSSRLRRRAPPFQALSDRLACSQSVCGPTRAPASGRVTSDCKPAVGPRYEHDDVRDIVAYRRDSDNPRRLLLLAGIDFARTPPPIIFGVDGGMLG